MKRSDITKINLLYESAGGVFLTEVETYAFVTGLTYSMRLAEDFPNLEDFFAEDYPYRWDRADLVATGRIGDLHDLDIEQLEWVEDVISGLTHASICSVRHTVESINAMHAAKKSALDKIEKVRYRKSATKDIDPELGFGDLLDVL